MDRLTTKIKKSNRIYRLFFPKRLAKKSIFSRLFSSAHFSRNAEISRSIQRGEYVFGQNSGAISDRLRFGISSLAESGCEIIAAYNVLVKFKIGCDIADLIKSFEKRGASFGGLFGTLPEATASLLREKGLDAEYCDRSYAKEFDSLAQASDACIFTFWWGGRSLVIHTVMLEKAPDGRGYLAVNLFKNEAISRVYSIESMIKQFGLEPVCLITVNSPKE